MDMFLCEALIDEKKENVITIFTFHNETFNSVTFIANINHIHWSLSDLELVEAYRVLK